jgi:CheY-like chemotaxis protein/phosphoribosyl 1,2-cyclic phosphodiesterase
MKVRFWGTRGSIATPGPDTIHFGGNTSCVEVTTNDGAHLILDCGTGARKLAVDLMSRDRNSLKVNILVGHTHWDHIQGFPFFSPLFVPGNSAAIYGPEEGRRSLQNVLAGQMEFTYFPVELSQLPAAITYNELSEGIHTIGGLRIAAQYLNHPAMTLGYRLEGDGVVVVYLVDHEPFSDRLWRADAEPGHIASILHEGDRRHANFMAGADLVIHDAQYTPEEYAVQMASAAGARCLALTHHDPDHDDHFVADIENRARSLAAQCGTGLDVFCAFEGCKLTLEPVKNMAPFVAPASGQPTVLHQKFRILVVDDQPDMLALIERVLQHEEYIVSTASNGSDALRMIAEQVPDLLVLDYQMAGMDGMAVTTALRLMPQTKSLPVLMLTTETDEPSTRAGFAAGVTDYVTKPFSIPQLASRVRACLTRHGSP